MNSEQPATGFARFSTLPLAGVTWALTVMAFLLFSTLDFPGMTIMMLVGPLAIVATCITLAALKQQPRA